MTRTPWPSMRYGIGRQTVQVVLEPSAVMTVVEGDVPLSIGCDATGCTRLMIAIGPAWGGALTPRSCPCAAGASKAASAGGTSRRAQRNKRAESRRGCCELAIAIAHVVALDPSVCLVIASVPSVGGPFNKDMYLVSESSRAAGITTP